MNRLVNSVRSGAEKTFELTGLGSMWRSVANGRIITQWVFWVPVIVTAFVLSPIAIRYFGNDPTAEALGLKHLQVVVYAATVGVLLHLIAYTASQVNDNLFRPEIQERWPIKTILYLAYFFALCYLAVNAR